MACYHPLKGFKGNNGGWTSKCSAYTMAGDFRFPKMNVPCGQCIGCSPGESPPVVSPYYA